MTRFNQAMAAAAILFAGPTAASALGIQLVNVSSTGASTTFLNNGDQITFDLRLENPTNVGVAGLDVVVSGFDIGNTTDNISSGFELVGGAVTGGAFNTVLTDYTITNCSVPGGEGLGGGGFGLHGWAMEGGKGDGGRSPRHAPRCAEFSVVRRPAALPRFERRRG